MPRIISSKRDSQYYRRLLVFAGRVIGLLAIFLYFGVPIFDVYRTIVDSRGM